MKYPKCGNISKQNKKKNIPFRNISCLSNANEGMTRPGQSQRVNCNDTEIRRTRVKRSNLRIDDNSLQALRFTRGSRHGHFLRSDELIDGGALANVWISNKTDNDRLAADFHMSSFCSEGRQ